MLQLSQSVCERLRENKLSANAVQISIKTPDLCVNEFQTQLNYPIHTSLHLCKTSFELFKNNFNWEKDVRAIGIRAINLSSSKIERQFTFLEDNIKIENFEKLEETSDNLRKRFGKNIIYPLSLKKDIFASN